MIVKCRIEDRTSSMMHSSDLSSSKGALRNTPLILIFHLDNKQEMRLES